MFNRIKNLFSDPVVAPKSGKTTVIETNVQKTTWRNNMWVMSSSGVGIIFSLGEPCIVHIVDSNTGETIKGIKAHSETLRQAKYLEIPENRRGDKDKAEKLGYL